MGNDVEYVEARGAKFAVRTVGSGKPMLALHGGFGTGQRWIDIARAAAIDGLMVIAPDARGHGLSSATPEPQAYFIPELAKDALAIADALGLDRVPIVGWSMGTRTASYIAANHPDRVASLGLSFPPPISHKSEIPRFFIALADDIRQRGFDTAIEAMKQRNPIAAENMRGMPRGSVAAMLTGVSGVEFDLTQDELGRIKCPTMVLGREGDTAHTVKVAQYYAANIRNARLKVVPFDDTDAACGDLLAWTAKNSIV